MIDVPDPDANRFRFEPRVASMRRLRRRLRPRPRPRFKGPSFNRIIPNILTLLGLCAGLTAMRFAIEGRFGAAAVSIATRKVSGPTLRVSLLWSSHSPLICLSLTKVPFVLSKSRTKTLPALVSTAQ